jgi:hypothetical protein
MRSSGERNHTKDLRGGRTYDASVSLVIEKVPDSAGERDCIATVRDPAVVMRAGPAVLAMQLPAMDGHHFQSEYHDQCRASMVGN